MEEFSVSFNTQDQTPDDPHTQVRQCDPYDFVENPRHCSQVIGRLLTKYDIPHPFLQLVSYDRVQELFQHIKILSYLGVSLTEFQFRCLRFRFVSHGVSFVLFIHLEINDDSVS
jgi:hypothetical protein